MNRIAAAWVLGMMLLALSSQAAGQAVEPELPPPPLSTVPVRLPPSLDQYVADRAAAVRLGKALFWDMQLGSDGVTACATCHFHAGADGRRRNQVNPGPDRRFRVGPPNHELSPSDFPLRQLAVPDDAASPLLRDSDDAIGSAGVNYSIFRAEGLIRGYAKELAFPAADGLFRVGSANSRRVTGRQAPSVFNAVFNHRNFWDGRAHDVFNGVNPMGPSDPTPRIFVHQGGRLSRVLVRIPNASLASQALGPPLSDVEMSADGRTWPAIGRKMLYARPLAQQMVHPQDSVLGGLSGASLLPGAPGRPPALGGYPGLRVGTYADLVRQAFRSEYWNASLGIRVGPGDYSRQALNRPPHPALLDEYTQMEANFSLFFGLAAMMYQSTLVSDQTPYDRFAAGDAAALSPAQQEGLRIFLNEGRCAACHTGPEFTSASVGQLVDPPVEVFPEYIADLRGANVSPPVQTQATGILQLVHNRAAGNIAATLDVIRAVNVQAAELRLGFAGQDGPVLWTLHDAAVDGPFNRLALRTLTEATLQPAPGVASLADAVNAIQSGQVYVVVRTQAFPQGEVRGQVGGPAEGPIERMAMSDGFAFYDVGFYNVGSRPWWRDVGRGAADGLGLPLSMAQLAVYKKRGYLPPDLRAYVPDLPPGLTDPPDRLAVWGSFKTPHLRNVELTGPYFHHGSMATLKQVVDFYVRGGDFRAENARFLNPAVAPIGSLRGDEARQNALVEFLLALTDPRVRQEQAPFDHPQLFVPTGRTTAGEAGRLANLRRYAASAGMRLFDPMEDVVEIPAVGSAGRAQMLLPPLGAFLGADPRAE